MKKCTGENCPMQMGYDVEKCAVIEKCPYRTWPVTIADRIRSMTDNELAGVAPIAQTEIQTNVTCASVRKKADLSRSASHL